MSESKAAEDYKVFESLRSRFSDANNIISSSNSPTRSEPRKSSKRRFDPRSSAPPLKPLIEEGDQLQEAMVSFLQKIRGRGWAAKPEEGGAGCVAGALTTKIA